MAVLTSGNAGSPTITTDQSTVGGAIESSIGWIAAGWRDDLLAEISIGHASEGAALARLESSGDAEFSTVLNDQQEDLLHRLKQQAERGDQCFADVSIDTSHLAPFAKRVVGRCRRIAPGATLTYAELAAQCGSPKAARAVGNVMASNRFPLVVPCHRVVGSGGGLGGFSAPQGVALKKQLLEREGVELA